jgi:cyanuric acid amidohydrolase
MQTLVYSIPMAHPADVSGLVRMIADGAIVPAEIVAVIGKTEGNGGVNDFTRGYFMQTLAHMLALHLEVPVESVFDKVLCVFSGGTEGVVSPHYMVFCRNAHGFDVRAAAASALAIGVAVSDPLPVEMIGRREHVMQVADTVRRAMRDAGITDASEVQFIQLKCPSVTAVAAMLAHAEGKNLLTTDPNRSMAYARAAGAFGVALALGEIAEDALDEAALLSDFRLYSTRASVATGLEVTRNEVIVLGNSKAWHGPYRIASQPMEDAIDINAVYAALDKVGIDARPQVRPADLSRIAGVFVKCEPDRRGRVRSSRNTMLDDTDISAQRHVRAAVGGLVAGVIGDGRLFVSGGAEHQGPDGGGLIAVIAAASGTVARMDETGSATPG